MLIFTSVSPFSRLPASKRARHCRVVSSFVLVSSLFMSVASRRSSLALSPSLVCMLVLCGLWSLSLTR
ncbi:hypothetical protein L0F63_007508, partial [Massospora cicadina]